jgi:hypothetical protein
VRSGADQEPANRPHRILRPPSTAAAGERTASYLPLSIRVVADHPLGDLQHPAHPARLGSKRWEPKGCAQQLGNLAGTRVCQREAHCT